MGGDGDFHPHIGADGSEVFGGTHRAVVSGEGFYVVE